MAGRGSSTERAKLCVELQWWTASCRLDSVRVGYGRVRGGMEELRGEVARLWRDGSRRGNERVARDGRRASDGALLDSGRASSRKGMEWTGRKLPGPAQRRRAALRRDCRRVEARRRPQRRYGVVAAQEKYWIAQ